MNRPIFIIVIGYIIGIIWGLYLQISIVPFYFLLLIIYIIIKLPYHKKKFRIFSIKRYFRYIKLIFKLNIIITIIISSFISNIQPFNLASQSAILYLSGNDVKNLFLETSTLIPITDSFGPVIPKSVIYAVPFFIILSSAV